MTIQDHVIAQARMPNAEPSMSTKGEYSVKLGRVQQRTQINPLGCTPHRVVADQPFAFFAANDNFAADELPTSIPLEKAMERAQIVRLTEGQPVTVCPPQSSVVPMMPWKALRADNDNQAPLSWPLAEQLRRDGREDDLVVCELYRGLVSIMAADPLQGRDAQMSTEDEPGLEIETRGGLNGREETEATGAVVGTGEIDYHEVRQLARTPGAPTKAVRKGEGDGGDRYRVTTAKFSERTLIAQIDSRQAYARLRSAIGPLLAAFEDSCLDGATMTEIGAARGFKDKQASAAGKALVYEAIGALSVEWRVIRDEEQALEKQADRNVIRFRAKLARRDADYLGIAA